MWTRSLTAEAGQEHGEVLVAGSQDSVSSEGLLPSIRHETALVGFQFYSYSVRASAPEPATAGREKLQCNRKQAGAGAG